MIFLKNLLLMIINLKCLVISANSADPRKNSSLYDVLVTGNPSHNTIIANCSDILYNKKSLNHSISIFKYKLIYYSPQLVQISDSSNYNLTTTNKFLNFKTDPLFAIDISNGSLHIKTPNEPLLEFLCIQKGYCSCFSCIFTLNIIYSTENKINADTIRVFIDDTNDYAPIFKNKQSVLKINISESSKIGDVFKLYNSTAVDSDAFYNTISYFLSTENIANNSDSNVIKYSNLFEVATSNESSNDLSLILKSHLDFESVKKYDLYLIARDNGHPHVFQNSKRLIVNIIDENDHNPICEKSLFIANLNENSIEKKFLRITATDSDTGLNSRLEYFIDEMDFKIQSLFEIDKNSGWLSLKVPLDYEKKSFYDLKIKVQDSGLKNVYKTYCSARINLIDLNDNPAKIKIIKYLNESVALNFYSLNTMSDANTLNEYNLEHTESRNQIELYENNQPLTVLALLRVFDFDTLSNYKFSIQSAISSQEDISMFQIRTTDKSSREFELITTGSFDAETIQSLKLKIILYDLQSSIDMDSNETIMINNNKPVKFFSENNSNNFKIFLFEKIKILDQNDNGPKFAKNSYEFSIKENSFNVYLNQKQSIKAFDFDTNIINSKLNYRIVDKNNETTLASSFISINDSHSNNNYPILVINKPFDYEKDGKLFEFYLIAYDKANLTDSTLVSIKIIDQNDNYPMFMNENTTFFIKENMLSNNFIGQVIAIDKDAHGPNSDISFRIVSKTLASVFKIYKSGVISNKIILDRDMQSFYPIQIEAYDFGEPSLTKTAYLYIQIEDENDNKPYFTYPNESTSHLFIKTPVNLTNSTKFKLIDLEANDIDYDLNAQITFLIESSTDNLLQINSENGSVYLDLFKFNLLNKSKMKIQATFAIKDSGTPSLKSEINFTFYINYEKNEIPNDFLNDHFSSGSTNFKKKFIKILTNSYFLLIVLLVSVALIAISAIMLICLLKRSSVSNNKCKKTFNDKSFDCFWNKFITKTRTRFARFKTSKNKVNKESSLTVKDISSKELITALNEIKNKNLKVENNSIMNASIMNNCSIADQTEDQNYGFINTSYSLINHKMDRNYTDNSNMKQLINCVNINDYQNPFSYRCRINEDPHGSLKIANKTSMNEELTESKQGKELLSLSPNIFSENQMSLTENSHNSSKILQNLLIKFEKFYNDAKV